MDNIIDHLDEDKIESNQKWICLLFYNKNKGIMCGGAYDTYEKALSRCNELKKTNVIFNIKIGELGKWLAHTPENDIKEKSTDEYLENIKLLNSLVCIQKSTIDNNINEHKKRIKDLLLNKDVNSTDKIPNVHKTNDGEIIDYNISKVSGQKYICYSFCAPLMNHNIWGIKIRGIFNSKEEAEKHCVYLTQQDKYFDIFIGKLGELYSYDTDINQIKDVKYRDDKLQKLIDKHKNIETNLETKTNVNHSQRKQELLTKLQNNTFNDNKEKLLQIIKEKTS